MYYPLLIVLVMIFMGAYFYPQLPARVPSHWDASGEVNGYSSRAVAVVSLPLIALLLYGFFLLIPRIEVFRKNVESFYRTSGPGFVSVFMLFFLILYVATLLAGVGYQFSMNYVILPLLALLFGYIGIVLPTVKRNFFIGIRTPWTLASERVWKKTHEMGGKVFIGMAVLMLVAMLLPAHAFWIMMILALFAVVWTFVYSYLEFRKEKRKGEGIDGL
ncbi:SdpI/YhfL protein family protein [Candidatus Burarchaeum australiense]|nr:SdpI/YhfL protein family protein [Candidatus Burarchaeum australiense]